MKKLLCKLAHKIIRKYENTDLCLGMEIKHDGKVFIVSKYHAVIENGCSSELKITAWDEEYFKRR